MEASQGVADDDFIDEYKLMKLTRKSIRKRGWRKGEIPIFLKQYEVH